MNYKDFGRELNGSESNFDVSVYGSRRGPESIKICAFGDLLATIDKDRNVKLSNLATNIQLRATYTSDIFSKIVDWAQNNTFDEMTDTPKAFYLDTLQAQMIYDALQCYFDQFRVHNHRQMTKAENDCLNSTRSSLVLQFNFNRLVNNEDDLDD